MARFDNNPFPNVTEADYANYQNWPAITLPDGQVVYEVPGNSGYVLDPVASNASGRKVFRQNPKGAITEQQDQKNAQKKAQDLAEQQASPMGQLLPIAGSVGGLIAANQLIPQAADPVQAAIAAQIEAQTAQQAGAAGVTAAIPTTQAGAAAQGALAAPTGLSGQVVPLAAEAPGFFGGGFMGGGGGALGASTPYLVGGAGLLGAYDLFANKKHGFSGAAQGAGSGALIGTSILPGVGTAIGAGVGGLAGYFGDFGDKDMYKTEGNRLQSLKDSGVNVPQHLIDGMPQAGRSKEQLVAEAQRTGGNVEFAQSRSESALKPIDIVGYAAFAENDPKWFDKTSDERLKIADQALKAGAVREHHGTIDVDFGKISPQTQAQAAAQGALVPARVANKKIEPWMR